jgi:hypothetical protein
LSSSTFGIKFHPYSANHIYAPIELLATTADVSTLSESSLAKNPELADNIWFPHHTPEAKVTFTG